MRCRESNQQSRQDSAVWLCVPTNRRRSFVGREPITLFLISAKNPSLVFKSYSARCELPKQPKWLGSLCTRLPAARTFASARAKHGTTREDKCEITFGCPL